jgi:hypothetical protein
MAIMKGRIPTDAMERFAYTQMRDQLPHDWVVLANVAWARFEQPKDFHSHGFLREGQADFVVLVPGQGLLVVEIKGSIGYRVAEGGSWFRLQRCGSGRATREELMQEAPPEQATRNMFSLVEHTTRQRGWHTFPGLFGWVVWFPQCEVAKGTEHLNDAATILSAKDNSSLTKRFRSTLATRGHSTRGELFDSARMSEVAQTLLSEGFRLEKADTAVDIAGDLGKVQALTTNQFSALQGIFWNERVAVTGPAGSGKTLLGVWRARAAKGEGRRVLITCFNKKLAEYLRVQYPDLKNEIVHVDKLFRTHIEARVAFPHPPSDANSARIFWREQVPDMLLDYIPSSVEQYDTIIVDEGQDFSHEQQLALQEFLSQKGGQYLFLWDSGQDLYGQKLTLPLGTTAFFVLEHNCRNTRTICDAATLVGERRVSSMPGMPDGVVPTIELVPTSQGVANRCWAIVNDWRKSIDGRIAVLSPYTLPKSSMAEVRQAFGLHLVEEPSRWDESGAILFSTIKSFKGIEADGVVVIDVEDPSDSVAMKTEDLYVACTRPVARLVLITKDKRLAVSVAALLERIAP